MKQATIKYNNGNLAILCSKCSIIIKTKKDFNEEETMFSLGKSKLKEQFCDKCKKYE
jgi:hypothetical protein